MATTALITAEEFEVMPGCKRCELIRGGIRERSFLGGHGARLSAQLTGELGLLNKEHQFGALYCGAGYVLARDPDTVLAPNISFVRSPRQPPEDREIGFLCQVPDLAVEIVAFEEGFSELFEKVAILHEAGVPLVWVFDVRCKRVMTWRSDNTAQILGQSDTLHGGDVLPGFRLPLTDVFR